MRKLRACLLVLCVFVCISSITFAASFTDTKGTVYEGIVDRIAGLGIVNGVSDQTFAPNKGITRGEMAKIIVYVKGMQNYADTAHFTPTFTDTKSHWAKNYIQVAVELGLLKGYEDETFRPDKEVTYAETIAIVLRALGYVNVDETSGAAWYSNYVKRMYDINLNQGMPAISSYTASAKRGDVAILWWNMLISNRWAIAYQTEGDGLTYTYANETPLQSLFPDYQYVRGTVTSIKNGDSGDTIAVSINGSWYNTFSEVPLFSLGALGTGVYDTKKEVLYGFSIDDDLSDYKIVAGPIFYLNELGYKLSNSRAQYAYGSKNNATYAILVVSESSDRILRSVLVDASDSVIFDSIKIEYDKNSSSSSKDRQFGRIYINGNNAADEQFASTDAVIIVNGQKVGWNSIPKGAILTSLIKGSLYTYETTIVEGKLTNYDNLKELYVDLDKYLVSSNCIYTVDGETVGNSTKLKEYRYSALTKKKLEELKVRNMKFHLNVANEITKIEFGKYAYDSVDDKYEKGLYKFFYVQKLSYPSGDTEVRLSGINVDGKSVKYTVEDSKGDSFDIGDLVAVEMDAKFKNEVKSVKVITSNSNFGDDIKVVYHPKDEYDEGTESFGQYTMTVDTLIYDVGMEYKTNSTTEIEGCSVKSISKIENLGDLSKYQFVLICNDDLDIEVVFAEKDVNRVTYPVARVVSLGKVKESESGDKNSLQYVDAKISLVDGKTENYKVLSNECKEGELITFDVEGKDTLVVKERFNTEFFGIDKDIVITAIDKKTKEISIQGTSRAFSLKASFFKFNGRDYDFDEYHFIMANVKKDSDDNWKFTSANFVDKDNISLKVGDRIAFDELNTIAVVYRGFEE